MRFWRWVVPIVLFILFAPFSSSLDLATSRFFYDKDLGTFSSFWLYHFVYTYGELPAIMVGIGASGVFLLSYLVKTWKRFRVPSLMLVLTLAIGCGLITNTLLKEYWGRPRPKQIIEFGGSQEYRPFYKPQFNRNLPMTMRSFPCGHCTMGFFFFSLILLGFRYKSKILIYLGFLMAVGLGLLLSLSRIAQGGHYLSDVIAAAFILWITALTIEFILFDSSESKKSKI
jgi:membrane-associated PAP2 superfamily phosphatase